MLHADQEHHLLHVLVVLFLSPALLQLLHLSLVMRLDQALEWIWRQDFSPQFAILPHHHLSTPRELLTVLSVPAGVD